MCLSKQISCERLPILYVENIFVGPCQLNVLPVGIYYREYTPINAVCERLMPN